MYVCSKYFLRLFGILALLINTLVSSQDSISCNNTIGESGQCTAIRKCETILNLLETYGNATSDFLRRFVCDFDDYGPNVCCPTISALNYGPLFSPDCGISIQNERTIKNTSADNTVITFPSRISVGEPAQVGVWPWIAALGYQSKRDPNEIKWNCGGSLISSRHVLTAAHCILTNLLVVRLGEIDLFRDDDGATPVDFTIEKIKIHPNYDSHLKIHDIAVLKLQRDVQFTDFVRPICLPIFDELLNENYVGRTSFIIGWGKLGPEGEKAQHLQQTQIPVVDTQICKRTYKRTRVVIDENIICAGHSEGGRDACQGDSGGPLMLLVNNTFYEIGIVSYGISCSFPNTPGIYTAVNRNMDFILSQLN